MPSPDLVRLPAGSAARAAADACPGALRLHEAADGPLARVRIPGGRITGAQLRSLRELSAEWGDAHVELTSRANLQLRGLRGAPAVQLAARLGAAGMLPSQTHELVRNIAASPLLADARRVAELDSALCSDPALAALPGRFLFAIDTGAGDVAYSADVAALPSPLPPGIAARSPERPDGSSDRFAVLFAGRDVGLRVGGDRVVPALIAAAHAFLALANEDAEGGDVPGPESGSIADGRAGSQGDAAGRRDAAGRGRRAWRLRDVPDGPMRAGMRVAAALGVELGVGDQTLRGPVVREPLGVIRQSDGRVAVGALVPLGRLADVPMKALERASDLVFTPWRGVVVPNLSEQAAGEWVGELTDVGLEVAAGSRWAGVTACAGKPGCAKALADVRHDADAATTAGTGLPVHWVGCVRGCGSPAGPHVRVEATGSGYAVSSPHGNGTSGAERVGALVAGLRES